MIEQTTERISDADRLLLARMEAEMVAAQRLHDFTWAHVAAIYNLKLGVDKIEDGLIIRATPPE